MASANVVTITDSNFDEEVLKASTPVLVDFWAEWCGPCKMIAPILDELADEKVGKLKVAKVNVDQSQQVAGRFQIRAIPTLLFFKDGEVKDQIVGMTSKRDLLAKAEALA
ncbi:MAG: thioredoxin [Verrucomicrobiota bacterium]